MYIDERLLKILETHKGETADVNFIISLIKTIAKEYETEQLRIGGVSFELPSDDIFDMPEVNLNNPLEEFYYYERPAYLEDDQKQFRERLQKALDYLKGN